MIQRGNGLMLGVCFFRAQVASFLRNRLRQKELPSIWCGSLYSEPVYELLKIKVVRKGGFDIPGRPKSKEISAKPKNPHQHWPLAPFH